jgi:hypothetical protein
METANIVHKIPDIFVDNAGSAIESFHCQIRTATVSDDSEDFPIGRSKIPGVVSEIRWGDFAGLFQYGCHFADTVTSGAMTFCAEPVVKSLTGFDGFGSGFYCVLQRLKINVCGGRSRCRGGLSIGATTCGADTYHECCRYDSKCRLSHTGKSSKDHCFRE